MDELYKDLLALNTQACKEKAQLTLIDNLLKDPIKERKKQQDLVDYLERRANLLRIIRKKRQRQRKK